jgi:hypothetical protein
MPSQYNFNWVSSATGDDTSLEFATNTAGDSLIAVFAATATSGDFEEPPGTLEDTLLNKWNLVYFNINNVGETSGVFNAVAVYVCNSCITGVSNSLFMPSELQPGDVLATWSNGAEYNGPGGGFSFANVQFAPSFPNAGGDTNIAVEFQNAIVPASQIAIFAGFDSSLTGQPMLIETTETNTTWGGVHENYTLNFGNNGTNSANATLAGWRFFNYMTTSNNLITPVGGDGTDSFAFVLVLSNTPSVPPKTPPTGGGSSQTLTFSINKGPEPIVPKEGRAVATVEIDCTQQAVVPLPINFPEYSLVGDASNFPIGFVICEFDLNHLFQGSGLSEVRSLMYWARPSFQYSNGAREDITYGEDAGFMFPAMITNTTTLQTIVLGAGAVNIEQGGGGGSYGEYGIVPFPGHHSAVKYRFIAPQSIFADGVWTPVGKYTLQFCNWEVMSAVISPPALLSFTTEE